MADGMVIMGEKTRPAILRRLSKKRFRITLKEGKNRQIRRMVRKMENHVVRLKRISFANIRLGNLPEGAWRHLREREKRQLLAPLEHETQADRSSRALRTKRHASTEDRLNGT
jgi:23S rRNA pseudouridine2605 synthase/23S rRNA pseudouridine2604 synthase